MDMEALLCPQISMDVDETPLNLGSPGKDDDDDDASDTAEIPLEVRLKLLLELEAFDSAQTPEPLTEEEEGLKNTLFSVGPAVQFMKLHCTSCNVHLGSSPINHFDRFIHPLLHVLLCKKCYEFYCSGEFEKDEDGSEMYCRWCGQGGKVMCCSDCAYVFCQKCVRQNLGKKALDAIKNSDDWKCFSCNPSQLINLKLICHSLYKYIEAEISVSKESNTVENLKTDYSMCCSKPARVIAKRKRSNSSEDVLYDPMGHPPDPKKKKPVKSVLKQVLSSFQTTNTSNSAKPLAPWKTQSKLVPGTGFYTNTPNTSAHTSYLKVKNLPKQQRSGIYMPKMNSKPPIVLSTSTNKPFTANTMQKKGNSNPARGSQNFIPMNNQTVIIVPSSGVQQPGQIAQACYSQSRQPVVNAIPASLTPGMKHRWFEQASNITNNITSNLNRKLAGFTIEQRNAVTIEQLANIHNKLQELLSSSVNSLIQVRKNLRNEFLNDLNKIKVANKIYTANIQGEQRNALEKDLNVSSKDDDVIIINNDEEDPLAICETVIDEDSTKDNNEINMPRSFIKVKPVSSLMDSSRLALSGEKMNGIPEQIDLCDDDDDDEYNDNYSHSIGDITSGKDLISNHDDVTLIDDETESVILNKDTVSSNVVRLKESINEKESEAEPCVMEINDADNDQDTILPEVDFETCRQIRRALAESKFESILQENSLIKVNENVIPKRKLPRYLTVRVQLHPKYQYKRKNKTTESKSVESIVPQDFEEMLSGSIVPIVLKNSLEVDSPQIEKTVPINEETEKITNYDNPESSYVNDKTKKPDTLKCSISLKNKHVQGIDVHSRGDSEVSRKDKILYLESKNDDCENNDLEMASKDDSREVLTTAVESSNNLKESEANIEPQEKNDLVPDHENETDNSEQDDVETSVNKDKLEQLIGTSESSNGDICTNLNEPTANEKIDVTIDLDDETYRSDSEDKIVENSANKDNLRENPNDKKGNGNNCIKDGNDIKETCDNLDEIGDKVDCPEIDSSKTVDEIEKEHISDLKSHENANRDFEDKNAVQEDISNNSDSFSNEKNDILDASFSFSDKLEDICKRKSGNENLVDDLAQQFDASTDPVTTTDSGIEVDSK